MLGKPYGNVNLTTADYNPGTSYAHVYTPQQAAGGLQVQLAGGLLGRSPGSQPAEGKLKIQAWAVALEATAATVLPVPLHTRLTGFHERGKRLP